MAVAEQEDLDYKLVLQLVGDTIWVNPPITSDRGFLRSTNARWDGKLHAYCVPVENLNTLMTGIASDTHIRENAWPPIFEPEDFAQKANAMLEDSMKITSLRLGNDDEGEDTVPEWMTSTCPKCHGTGRKEEDKECNYCLGSGKLEPRLYQYQAARYLQMKKKAILSLPVGMGKSISAISSVRLIMKHTPILIVGEPVAIVLCPANLKRQWVAEIAKFSKLKVQLIDGPPPKRKLQYEAAYYADIVIINPELALRDCFEVIPLMDAAQAIIVDEATMLKNSRADISKLMKRIAKSTQTKYLYLLTGTPMMNSILELFMLMSLIDPDILGSEKKFKYKHLPRAKDGTWIMHGCKNSEELRAKAAPHMFSRVPKEIADQIPDVIAKLEPVKLHHKQREMYEAMRNEAMVELSKYNDSEDAKDKFLVITNVLAMIIRMKQLCDHPAILEATNIPSPKLERLVGLMTEDLINDKVIIFTQFVRMADIIKARLDKEGIPATMLTGGMPGRAKDESVQKFQTDDNCRVIVITTAGGMGLNMTAASAMIIVDLLWNPQLLGKQIIGRAARLGNAADNVQVITLFALNTVDDRILKRLEAKAATYNAVIEGAKDVTEANSIFSELVVLLKGTEPDDWAKSLPSEVNIDETSEEDEEVEGDEDDDGDKQ